MIVIAPTGNPLQTAERLADQGFDIALAPEGRYLRDGTVRVGRAPVPIGGHRRNRRARRRRRIRSPLERGSARSTRGPIDRPTPPKRQRRTKPFDPRRLSGGATPAGRAGRGPSSGRGKRRQCVEKSR